MRDLLPVIKNLKTLEARTGVNLTSFVKEVNPMKVVAAFKYLPLEQLVFIVLNVPIKRIVEGVKIIRVSEISSIDVEILKIVIMNADLVTLRKLNESFSDEMIINTLNRLSHERIRTLLVRNNYDEIANVIKDLGV